MGLQQAMLTMRLTTTTVLFAIAERLTLVTVRLSSLIYRMNTSLVKPILLESLLLVQTVEGMGFKQQPCQETSFAGNFSLNSNSENLELNGGFIQHSSRTDSGIWYFNWDAPEEVTETITFSASGIGTGGSSGYSGDRVYTVQVEIQPQSVGILSSDPLISFSLDGNYPNPFNGETIISYVIPKDGFVNISIFNVAGQFITSLVNDYQLRGEKKIFWDTKDATGNYVPSGVYYYVVSNGIYKEARTMTLLK